MNSFRLPSKTLPLPCPSTAVLVAKTAPLHHVSTALVAEKLYDSAFPCGPQVRAEPAGVRAEGPRDAGAAAATHRTAASSVHAGGPRGLTCCLGCLSGRAGGRGGAEVRHVGAERGEDDEGISGPE